MNNIIFDSEGEVQDFPRLKAALKKNDISITQQQSQLSVGTPLITNNSQYSSSDVDTAITLNLLYDKKLKALENTIVNRLHECRKSLQELQNTVIHKSHNANFTILNCGKPYFKDKFGFPAPSNVDTFKRANAGMYDFTNMSNIQGWTVQDKSEFMKKILEMSRKIKQKELESALAKAKSNKRSQNKNEIEQIKIEIRKVKKMPLEDVVLPVNKDYDWEQIAIEMKYRHKPQEYKALWNLFLHPSFNKGPWAKKECWRLEKICSQKQYQDWDSIAKELRTNRTGYQCFVYYHTNINNTFTSKEWTKKEVEHLKRLVEFHKEHDYIPWTKIAACMENRTRIQVYNKFIQLNSKRKGRFIPEEDAVIIACADKFGPDFKKMKMYLPGRSVPQCRVRYNILAKQKTSITWTKQEDRKLMQLVANQDSPTIFASLTKYFPGKDRYHLRSRYKVLTKWIEKNPNVDFAYAPRRPARCLVHGNESLNLKKALENLKLRMQDKLQSEKDKTITLQSSEQKIDDAIINYLLKEKISYKNIAKQKSQRIINSPIPEDKNFLKIEDESDILTKKSVNFRNVRQILVLLRAKLDKQKFMDSKLCKRFPDLLHLDNHLYISKLKSYSKQKKLSPDDINKKVVPDIWGQHPLGSLQYVLPPNLATITGCRLILESLPDHPYRKRPLQCLHKNASVTRIFERFYIIFMWPMLLSENQPKYVNIDAQGINQSASNKTINSDMAIESSIFKYEIK
ncbi:snRNA-activating protein complex subunit 4-like [Leptidea sinapis]|uniref:snRNA-activating protein complex subunit 4-like n=1 Tax=Leptidea sinapis TaxID=189913 RepID=UPI0021C42A87|nr:snRNA-activating protein complex subunit 4-like [Leptidea sinapis]